MDVQEKELTQRLHAARLARLDVQRMRRLAAERAEKLERELKNAADAGLRAEISRTLEMRGRLRASVKPKSAPRYSAIAAFGLLLGVAALGMGWAPSQNAADSVLPAVPGEPLKLALSYSVSPPSAR